MDTLMSFTSLDTRDAIKKYIHYIDVEIVDENNIKVISGTENFICEFR
ncbi:hypothetical protein ACFQ0R_02710 [Psychroflexus salinarum]|uniref:Uncharacterized protein n=1 Tax=Psychroflexus salinarum TaxID=546024 RepID=A0ABW3GLP1_9FLAO